MKNKILVFITIILALATIFCVSALTVSAEEAEPSVTIAKFNLAFEDNTYLKYAVRFDGVADEKITENNIGMLYWTSYEGGFVPGTEDYSSATTGYTDISGVKHYVFEYTHLAAKQLTDYIYSVAYIELDGETYYSEPVKYSALEYAYNRLGKTSTGTTNEKLKTLLNNMLVYGASAQQYFDYKEDRLATADFYQITLVGGMLDDGFTSGLYLTTDEVTITAPETSGELVFDSWTNSLDETVSTDNLLTVRNLTSNVTYIANYEEVVKYSKGLEYTSNGDGTCYVSGIGTCTDAHLMIPSISPAGDRVTSIGAGAFVRCTNFSNVTISDSITSIGTQSFLDCTSLTSLTIPDSVTCIDYCVFWNCTSLESVVIGDGVISIGDEVFGFCTNLTSITIGSSVESIGSNAFTDCPSLKYNEYHNAYYLGNEHNPYVVLIKAKSEDIISCNIHEDTRVVYDRAFEDCSSLTSIVIPDSVTSISYGVFQGCSSLTSVVIGDSVTSIDYYAFEDCSSLTSIVIGDSVTSIGYGAFSDCSSLTAVYYTGSEAEWAEMSIDNSYGYNSNLINAPRYYYSETQPTEEGNFWHYVDGVPTVWPEYIKKHQAPGLYDECNNLIASWDTLVNTYGMDIENDYTYAYYESTSSMYYVLTNILELTDGVKLVIDNNITSLGDYAFAGCSNLISVVISDSVTYIGERVFFECASLTSIMVVGNNANYKSINGNLYSKDVKTLIQYAIGKQDTNFTIPDNVTTIGNDAFRYCRQLTSIIIPDSVIAINKYAFDGCSNLNSITIGNCVATIGESAFGGCSGLTSVVIPDSVITIGLFAFSGCENLVSVVIPKSVTTIGSYAFLICNNLKDVYYTGTEEQWKATSILSGNKCLTNATIHYNYVPEE